MFDQSFVVSGFKPSYEVNHSLFRNCSGDQTGYGPFYNDVFEFVVRDRTCINLGELCKSWSDEILWNTNNSSSLNFFAFGCLLVEFVELLRVLKEPWSNKSASNFDKKADRISHQSLVSWITENAPQRGW